MKPLSKTHYHSLKTESYEYRVTPSVMAEFVISKHDLDGNLLSKKRYDSLQARKWQKKAEEQSGETFKRVEE